MRNLISVFLILFVGSASAEPITPQPGTQLRRDVLDAARVAAEADLGAPVRFVVQELLVDAGRAFAILDAQRPDGSAVDLALTPLVLEQGRPIDLIDGPIFIGYLYQSDGRWITDDYVIGPTDVWWADGRFCAKYSAVVPYNIC
ncbi:hypothetical protein CLV80_10512 [Yoonia maritima]|uniref:Uncharacterized protein n=1 Tax=Yoonia maritima TaxID=1435347 RepID=A0A2T0VYX6_9RHOB|nr:hypothetical protein [Yoonia maritima]PRY77533.1 hypothetical protein CLV80_10512 [Yoonia maritima]